MTSDAHHTAGSLHPVQRAGTSVPRYQSPRTLKDALAVLATGDGPVLPVAGGTDLLVELDRGGHQGTALLLDLSRIDGLADIRLDGESLHLGPLVTHNQVVASALCREHALPLAQASLEVGSPQLRNRATVVGNVVTASPANDSISALLALGAEVDIASASTTRSMRVDDFIEDFRTTNLAADELVTGIRIPKMASDERGLFVKLGLRQAQAISVVHLAGVIAVNDGQVTSASLALGSVAPTVLLVPDLAERVAGLGLGSEMADAAAMAAAEVAKPIDDLRASADYRSELVATMTKRAFTALGAGEQAAHWPDRPPLLWGANFDGRFPTAAHPAESITATDPITCEVNGSPVIGTNAPGTTLLDWLRDEAGAKGVKEGCAEGECGACTVDLDGAAVMSCLVPAGRASDTKITTVEGLANNGDLHPVQSAFVQAGAVQCGFCTPGFVMSCAKLLEELPDPTPQQISAGLAGNLCRCTGYRAIETAVDIAAGTGGVR